MSSDPISILFLGTADFAVPALRALAANPAFDVTAVITQPDKPVGRKQEVTAPPVKRAALELGLRVLQPEKINAGFASLTLAKPDFLVAVAYGQILSEGILSFPKIAPVNIHASLLPKFRGASPIQHTILEGETEAGVSIIKMVRALDAGPILAQRNVPIGARETSASLHDALSELGAKLLVDTLTSPLNPHEQDDAKATVCRKLTRADGLVDPQTMSAEDIDRRVRALVPWPGVTWNGVKLLETSLAHSADAYEVACAQGTMLYVTKLQPAGRKAMTGAEFVRGRKKSEK